MSEDLEQLLQRIRERCAGLHPGSCKKESLLAHIRSLAEDDTFLPAAEATVFPERIVIAFATCRCGVREFIVDGSTQECQHCGSLMFRHDTVEYRRD